MRLFDVHESPTDSIARAVNAMVDTRTPRYASAHVKGLQSGTLLTFLLGDSEE